MPLTRPLATTLPRFSGTRVPVPRYEAENISITRMWANAQRDGRHAEYRWRPLFNAAKFG